MSRYNFVLFLIALSLALPPSAAEVEDVTYCDSLTIDGPGWAENHTLPLFDPGLGDLVGVSLTVAIELVQDFKFENTGAAPQTVDLNSSVELLVNAPESGEVSVIASILIREELAGFDGEEDYSGPSGLTIEGATDRSYETVEYADGSDFIASYPDETISLPASASYLSGGSPVPSNCISSAKGSARSEICLTYRYEPKAAGEGGITE